VAEGPADPLRRTQFAQRGLDFAQLFNARFRNTSIVGYSAALREPDGVSTGGGKQATQHIVLVSAVQGAMSFTVGNVNLATKTAKLRNYECMATLHRQRFRGHELFLDPAQYQELFNQILSMMKKQGLMVEIETRPPEVAPSSREGSVTRPGISPAWLIIALLLGAAAVFVALVMLNIVEIG